MVTKQGVKTFSPKDALKALSADYFLEDVCRERLLRDLHPDGAHCPGCGATLEDETTIKNFWEMRRCQCQICRRWFTGTTGTILHNSQLDMRQAYLLAVFLALKMPIDEIARILNISSVTVRYWRIRFS